MFVKTITKKCSCGYMFKRSLTIKKLGTEGAEQVIKTEILNGNQDFKPMSLMCDPKSKAIDFIVCPKCGALLLSGIAVDISQIEE